MGLLGKIWGGVKDVVGFIPEQSANMTSKIWHGATGLPTSKEKREQKRMLNEQISAYREQTEIAKEQMNIAKEAQDVEKRRIQEKQIRSIRRNSSMRGFLGTSGDQADAGINSKLGA